MPTDVALTTMSARPTSSDPPTRATAPVRRRQPPAPRVRLTTAMSAAPARPSASTRLRAAAPAPTIDHSPALDGDAGGRQRSDEPVAVGAVADQRGAVADDGVDRLQRRRSRRQLVDRRRHLRLQGRRHRQSDQPECAHRVDGRGAGSGRHVEGHVVPVEAGGRERGPVQRRRQRVRDRGSDDRRDGHRPTDRVASFRGGAPVRHGGRSSAFAGRISPSKPAAAAAAMLASCCSAVAAKAWFPSSSAIT